MANVDIEMVKRLILQVVENQQPSRMTHGTVTSINPLRIKLDNEVELTDELVTLTWTEKLSSAYLNKKLVLVRQYGGGHYYALYRDVGASNTSTGNVASNIDFDVPEKLKFADSIIRLIVKYAKNLKPSVSIAQAMLESELTPTNKGSGLALRYNNWFGIKAGTGWNGKVTALSTFEDDGSGNNYTIQAGFRWYDSMEDSVKDHEALFDTEFSKHHYAQVLSATTAEGQCRALQGTYATDTSYASKLIGIINTYDLKRFDSLQVANAEGVDAKLEAMIQWMYSKLGKVTYSMTYRNGPYSYDCSSSVFYAMIHAGILPKGTHPGSTETLFGMVGTKLRKINRSEVRRGDIFVSGYPGASAGAAGHTGIAINNNQIIHCTYPKNGMAVTPIPGWTGAPCNWYRIIL
ncbi:glucosaminidase domain-containing protein [Aerococcaceae bacterium NML191219]|nr:glucosaminidase domain-containing protein [Aerococcaceae bacterium NML191219]